MKHFSLSDVQTLEREYRRTFINCLWGLKSVHLIGTINKNSVPNLSIVSSLFHVGANPPMVGICFRPLVANTQSFDNILASGQFTLNLVNETFYKQAHRCSANFRDGVSEFDETALIPLYELNIPTPFVEQSPLRCLVEYHEHFEVTNNGSRIVIGNIKEIYFEDSIVDRNGFISHDKLQTVVVNGLEGYYSTKEIDRLGYERV